MCLSYLREFKLLVASTNSIVSLARELKAQFAQTNSCPLPPTHISDTNWFSLVTLLDIAGLFLIALFSFFCVYCVQVYFIFSAYTTFCACHQSCHVTLFIHAWRF